MQVIHNDFFHSNTHNQWWYFDSVKTNRIYVFVVVVRSIKSHQAFEYLNLFPHRKREMREMCMETSQTQRVLINVKRCKTKQISSGSSISDDNNSNTREQNIVRYSCVLLLLLLPVYAMQTARRLQAMNDRYRCRTSRDGKNWKRKHAQIQTHTSEHKKRWPTIDASCRAQRNGCCTVPCIEDTNKKI